MSSAIYALFPAGFWRPAVLCEQAEVCGGTVRAGQDPGHFVQVHRRAVRNDEQPARRVPAETVPESGLVGRGIAKPRPVETLVALREVERVLPLLVHQAAVAGPDTPIQADALEGIVRQVRDQRAQERAGIGRARDFQHRRGQHRQQVAIHNPVLGHDLRQPVVHELPEARRQFRLHDGLTLCEQQQAARGRQRQKRQGQSAGGCLLRAGSSAPGRPRRH